EGAHQKNSAAGGLQEVFVSQRVRHLMQIETLPLIDDVNHELIAGHLELELNLLVPLLFISVADGIDHALAHGHADLQAVVIVEARSSGHALRYALGKGHAVEQPLHDHFNAFGSICHNIDTGPIG